MNVVRFRRYECKYVIDEGQADLVRRAVLPFVQPDPYAAGRPDTSYGIESLYLDAPDLLLFRETEEGHTQRLKLRIRDYTDGPTDTGVFLEIKRKYVRLVLKDRAAVSRLVASRLVAGVATLVDGLSPRELACHDEFVAWVARWRAQPVVWVRYTREAYVGIYNEGLRITFDRNLRCSAGDSLAIPDDAAWYLCDPGSVVLELKFNAHYPDWLRRVVRRFGLRQRSYSKYGNAVRFGLRRYRLVPSAQSQLTC